jgi:predicted DsbA family dithiol-disulfide isomerase
MENKPKIDIISDVMCPYCLVGFKRLEKAISETEVRDRIELEWHPFELNPDIPAVGEDLREHMGRKYGMATDDCLVFESEIARMGADLHFSFDFYDGMKIVNTRDAHVLLEYANELGQQTELQMRLFEAFFTEHQDVSDRDVLARELEQVGLNVGEAVARLDDPAAQDRIKAREESWISSGVSAVPTMIFNQSNVLVGAQPIDVYKRALAEMIGDDK